MMVHVHCRKLWVACFLIMFCFQNYSSELHAATYLDFDFMLMVVHMSSKEKHTGLTKETMIAGPTQVCQIRQMQRIANMLLMALVEKRQLLFSNFRTRTCGLLDAPHAQVYCYIRMAAVPTGRPRHSPGCGLDRMPLSSSRCSLVRSIFGAKIRRPRDTCLSESSLLSN